MPNSVTLKDVASLAGVSYQTVSKVIHQSIQVKKETADRVTKAIDALGYVPNESARNLRTTQVSVIGYGWQPLTEQVVNPILEGFLQGMMSAASEQDFQIFCFPTTGRMENDLPAYERLYQSKKVGGFILSNIETDDCRIRYLMERNIPFVCFGDPQSDIVAYAEVDGNKGMRMVIDHLVHQGHQRIALLAWEGESRVGVVRYQGYREGLEYNGINFSENLIKYGPGSVESGYRLTRELLLIDPPTAIAAMNDLMAIGAMNAVVEFGLVPGVDIAICGYDDFPLAAYLHPSLTTVHQPAFLVGELTVQFLIDQLYQEKGKQKKMIFTPELIIRESSSQRFQK